MAIKLYNSLSRRKELFAPRDPERIGIYVCGPTVYDRAHIGNARSVVVFDVLYRLLRETFGPSHVRYVRNITDIDDKIIAAARETGQSVAQLTRRMTRFFHEDMKALDALSPDVEPRASEHIPQMIAMIERLAAKGCAYLADGHVLFAVGAAPKYGELSRKSRAELLAGARVEVAPYKRDPGDFVLWKPSPAELPGWESPWGRGRPGWHIECSAMSEAHLGESFDIHAGGVDLIFPHHENELAQSLCAHDGRPFARFWVHNGFLTAEGAKMSKSLGNIRTVRELLEKAPGEAIRLALLSTHYRDPLDWTDEKLRQAIEILDRFYRALDEPRFARGGPGEAAAEEVREALEDDLNTPLAIARLQSLAAAIYRAKEEGERRKLQERLAASGRLLGLFGKDPGEWLRSAEAPQSPRIEELIALRAAARREKRFADADKIRAELAAEGVFLEDHPDGATTWRTRH